MTVLPFSEENLYASGSEPDIADNQESINVELDTSERLEQELTEKIEQEQKLLDADHEEEAKKVKRTNSSISRLLLNRLLEFLNAPPVMEPPGLISSPSRVTIRMDWCVELDTSERLEEELTKKIEQEQKLLDAGHEEEAQKVKQTEEIHLEFASLEQKFSSSSS